MGIKRRSPRVPDCTALTHGFTELYHVIADEAPDAVKTGEIKNHFGRKVAIVGIFFSRLITQLTSPRMHR